MARLLALVDEDDAAAVAGNSGGASGDNTPVAKGLTRVYTSKRDHSSFGTYVLRFEKIAERLKTLPDFVYNITIQEGQNLTQTFVEYILASYCVRELTFPLVALHVGVPEEGGEVACTGVHEVTAKVTRRGAPRAERRSDVGGKDGNDNNDDASLDKSERAPAA
uniref:Uncharacterized protein n=1 Tax=Oryza punctata TaxID=4537 RepID=A0A0E0MEB7_ORYPU